MLRLKLIHVSKSDLARILMSQLGYRIRTGRHFDAKKKTADILQQIFWNAFRWWRNIIFHLKFDWGSFLTNPLIHSRVKLCIDRRDIKPFSVYNTCMCIILILINQIYSYSSRVILLVYGKICDCASAHDDDMAWTFFPRYWPLWRESTLYRWILLTKVQKFGASMFSFIYTLACINCLHKLKKKIKWPVIGDAMTVIWCHYNAVNQA